LIKLKVSDDATAIILAKKLDGMINDLKNKNEMNIVVPDWIEYVSGWPKDVIDTIKNTVGSVGLNINVGELSEEDKQHLIDTMVSIKGDLLLKGKIGIEVRDDSLASFYARAKKVG